MDNRENEMEMWCVDYSQLSGFVGILIPVQCTTSIAVTGADNRRKGGMKGKNTNAHTKRASYGKDRGLFCALYGSTSRGSRRRERDSGHVHAWNFATMQKLSRILRSNRVSFFCHSYLYGVSWMNLSGYINTLPVIDFRTRDSSFLR